MRYQAALRPDPFRLFDFSPRSHYKGAKNFLPSRRDLPERRLIFAHPVEFGIFHGSRQPMASSRRHRTAIPRQFRCSRYFSRPSAPLRSTGKLRREARRGRSPVARTRPSGSTRGRLDASSGSARKKRLTEAAETLIVAAHGRQRLGESTLSAARNNASSRRKNGRRKMSTYLPVCRKGVLVFHGCAGVDLFSALLSAGRRVSSTHRAKPCSAAAAGSFLTTALQGAGRIGNLFTLEPSTSLEGCCMPEELRKQEPEQILRFRGPQAETITSAVEIVKPISWPAVFSGTFVALATELLFAAFGFFIAFRIASMSALSAWAIAWYLFTAFWSLLIGGWVAARLSANPRPGIGRMHGLVTWGLTTVATLALFSFLVSGSAAIVRTAALVADSAASPSSSGSESATAMINSGAASLTALILFGGLVLSAFSSIIGGSAGTPKPPMATTA